MIFFTRKYLWIVGAVFIFLVADIAFAAHYSVLPENTYNLLPSLATPKSTDRILLVSPHPDDETIGAAGYLQEAVSVHAAVRIVLATDGNKHGLKDARHQEFINALGKVGVQPDALTFLDFPDGNLKGQTAFPARIQEIVDEFHPNIVIGTHPEDTHPDHAAVGRALEAVGKNSNHTITAYFFLVHYHRYPRPEGYEPDKYLLPAGRLVDSQSHWENLPLSNAEEQTKETAINQYQTQLSRKNPILRGLLLSFIRKNEVFAVKTY